MCTISNNSVSRDSKTRSSFSNAACSLKRNCVLWANISHAYDFIFHSFKFDTFDVSLMANVNSRNLFLSLLWLNLCIITPLMIWWASSKIYTLTGIYLKQLWFLFNQVIHSLCMYVCVSARMRRSWTSDKMMRNGCLKSWRERDAKRAITQTWAELIVFFWTRGEACFLKIMWAVIAWRITLCHKRKRVNFSRKENNSIGGCYAVTKVF